MAADIQQNYGTDTAVTISLDNLANGSSVVSSAIDLGNPGPFSLTLEMLLNGAGAGATGMAEIYAQWSNDNSDFSDAGNDLLVGVVRLNGTTAVKKVMAMPVHARYLQLRAFNNSGAALSASANAIRYVPVTVDQA